RAREIARVVDERPIEHLPDTVSDVARRQVNAVAVEVAVVTIDTIDSNFAESPDPVRHACGVFEYFRRAERAGDHGREPGNAWGSSRSAAGAAVLAEPVERRLNGGVLVHEPRARVGIDRGAKVSKIKLSGAAACRTAVRDGDEHAGDVLRHAAIERPRTVLIGIP